MPPLSTGRNGAPTTVEPDSDVARGPAPERRYFRLPGMSRVSIQSKLLVMLLITSVLSVAIVGYIGYLSGRASLQARERIDTALRIIAPAMRLTQADHDELLSRVRITRYGADEPLQFAGQVPKRMTFIVNGTVALVVSGDGGVMIPVRTLEEGDFLGQTALTREPVTASAYALDEVTVPQIDRAHVEELVGRKPLLLQDIGRAIEERRQNVRRAVAAAGD